MTVLEALQSMVEYDNDNLLSKALTDQAISPTTTYSLSYQEQVELAAADVYLAMCNHSNFKQGSKYIDYSKGALMSLRREILRKWNKLPTTISVPQDSSYNKLW